MQPNVIPSEHTREALPASQRTNQTLRQLFGEEIKPSEAMQAVFGAYRKRVQEADREHTRLYSIAMTPAGQQVADEWWRREYKAAQQERDEAVQAILRQDAQKAHARHETRDERDEAAAEAARAEAAAEGGRRR